MIEVGRLLRSSINGCVVGCKVSQENVPEFGSLVRIPITEQPFYQVFALVYDIHVLDDGLVRQLVTSEGVPEEVILDNRINRNVPLELSALFVGYQLEQEIYHLIPPKPPLALDAIYPCLQEDLCRFCEAGRFGYFRHILRPADLPVGELLAAHLRDVNAAQNTVGGSGWVEAATREVITLLRDDYPNLMSVLSALADARLEYSESL
ncbi:MAG: hypothetical protein HPY59_04865 [Anaerolineae bacterium]|nr:hypothetical protein [Anaerolineae bacterium]